MANPLDPTIPQQPEITAFDIQPGMSEADMKKKLYALLAKSMSEQSAQIEALKAQAAKEQALQAQAGVLGNLDFRPFAQALRGYGATNVAVPAEAPEDRTAIMNKLQNAVVEAQQGLTKEQVNALRSMMEDKRAAQAGVSQKNQEVRMFNYAQGKYLKPAEDYLKGSGQYNFVRNELATGQPSRINRALSQYARTMGQTGVLTDNDIRLQLPPTFVSALDRAYTYVTGNPDAELPPEIVSDLINTLDSGQAATQQAYQKKLDLVHQSFLQGPYAAMPGLDNLYKQSTKSILGGAGTGKEEKKPGYMPPASDIEAEDKRRAAAKKK